MPKLLSPSVAPAAPCFAISACSAAVRSVKLLRALTVPAPIPCIKVVFVVPEPLRPPMAPVAADFAPAAFCEAFNPGNFAIPVVAPIVAFFAISARAESLRAVKLVTPTTAPVLMT